MNNDKRNITHILCYTAIIFSAILVVNNASAQGNITFDLKKPKLYENRKLPSELTPDSKINPIKKLKENVATHYNFYFNARNKINNVVNTAKKNHKDTFSNLITINNYSLDETAIQQKELDSVITKSNNGVLLHDLRNDWVDDLYFLIGQSYFYQKKFDSAYDVFQYINYNFQPRQKNEIGFEKSIGSNINNEGNVFNISSKEKRGFLGMGKHQLIRNDALLWLIRSLMELNNDDEAKGLIETLYRDENFPNRLRAELAEQKASWFYKNGQYDSAAHYLEESMSTCINDTEKARRYFLIGQLYALKKQAEKADRFFEKSISLTIDPIMDAFARIQQIGIASGGADENRKIDANIHSLINMSEKEKFESYRPIIFASVAELALKKKDSTAAITYLEKSNQSNKIEPYLKNKNNLTIATLAFGQKNYSLAKTYYDSVSLDNNPNADEIIKKKSLVSELVKNIKIADREDSLQKIAFMPEKERDIFVRGLLKKLQKEKGIIESNERNGVPSSPRNNLLDVTTGSLFTGESQKGEWYFDNPSLRAQGTTAFKNKWGKRPNSDNWRRNSALNSMIKSGIPVPDENLKTIELDSTILQTDLSMEGLLENLPLSEEKLALSNQKKFAAYKQLGLIYKNKLGVCKESIFWNEKLIAESPGDPDLEQILFDLSFCYKENGNVSKSSFYQNQLNKNFQSSRFNMILKDPQSIIQVEKEKGMQATRDYEKIYDLFLSGKFDRAVEEKSKADALYGKNKWSPQLLYIESIFYIKKKDDSLAIATLNKITALYPTSPLAEKAGIIAGVVKRRAEIETELKGMDITRASKDSTEWIDDNTTVREKITGIKIETAPKTITPTITKQKISIDTTALKIIATEKRKEGFVFEPNESQLVLLLLKNVDIVYVNEAKRALAKYNSSKFLEKNLELKQDKIEETTFIQISQFPDIVEAIDYIDKSRILGPTEIFPWLPADKYNFIMISPSNLKLLMEMKNIDLYIQFIKQELPGKF